MYHDVGQQMKQVGSRKKPKTPLVSSIQKFKFKESSFLPEVAVCGDMSISNHSLLEGMCDNAFGLQATGALNTF